MTADDRAGKATFRVKTHNFRNPTRDASVSIELDTDQNPATGGHNGGRGGIEYRVFVSGKREAASLARWDGTEWEWLDYSTVRLESWSYGPEITLDLREIGNPQAFNFRVGAWGEGRSGDIAPGRGTWTYRVGSATTPPPPERDTTVFEPRDIYDRPSRSYSPGRIVVHYVTTGPDAPSLADYDYDSVPDYVEEIARVADEALARFERLGFRPPSPDRHGPDARVDIYLKTPDGVDYKGRAWAGSAFSFYWGDGGYAFVKPDSYGPVADHVRQAVVHELFHLVQYAYVPRTMPCWVGEGTAGVFEVTAYPVAGGRAEERTEDWLEQPWKPLPQATYDDDKKFCYAALAWFGFLHERDPGLIPAYFELLSAGGDPVKALDEATRRRGLGEAGSLYAQFAAAMWNHGHTVYTWRTVYPSGEIGATDYWGVQPLAAHYIPVESSYGCLVGLRVEGQVAALLVVDGRLAAPAETANGEVTFIENICLSGYALSDNVMLIVTSAGTEQASYRIVHRSE